MKSEDIIFYLTKYGDLCSESIGSTHSFLDL